MFIMKTIIMKNLLFKFLPAVAIALGVVSCSEDDDMPAQAQVMVVHASPNAPNVDVRVNNTVAFSNVAFPNNSNYLSVNAGQANFKISPTGTTTYVIDANVNLTENMNYSVFAIDSVSKIKAAVVTDNLAAPASGKAHIRFLHFSPNAPAVDIAISGGPVVFANRSFNDQAMNAGVTNFTPVDAGTYTFQVRPTGTQTIALSVPNVTLTAGKIYTVFAKGFLNGTGAQALGAQLIVHN